MNFWQWLIEFSKTVGLGAIFGAVVGAAMTRTQKRKEILQTIKAENYREVVKGYTDLAIHLSRTQESARAALVLAGALLTVKTSDEYDISDEARESLERELDAAYLEYEKVSEGLSEKIAPIATHQGETVFFVSLWLVGTSASSIRHSLWALTHSVTDENYRNADGAIDDLRDQVRNLNKRWSSWKAREERLAAGLAATPALQTIVKLIRRAVPRKRKT